MRGCNIWLRTGSGHGRLHPNRSISIGSYLHGLTVHRLRQSDLALRSLSLSQPRSRLFFADVQSPFEVESLEGSVYKIGIIEAMTLSLWMTILSSQKVDGVLDRRLKDSIPWMRAQHGLKDFKFQMDNGEFNSKPCKDLVAASGGTDHKLSLRT